MMKTGKTSENGKNVDGTRMDIKSNVSSEANLLNCQTCKSGAKVVQKWRKIPKKSLPRLVLHTDSKMKKAQKVHNNLT